MRLQSVACRLFLHLLLFLGPWEQIIEFLSLHQENSALLLTVLAKFFLQIIRKYADGSRIMLDDSDKETNVLQLHSMDVQPHSSSHMHHMDSSLIVFFKLEDLKIGKTMQVYFPKRDPSKSPHLLSKEKADSIPFSLKQAPSLLQFFSFPQDSPQAKAMTDTLRQCENKPIEGETKMCATSLESMLDFTRVIFGFDKNIKVLSTNHQTKSPVLIQNYTIIQVPRETQAPKMVACHTMPYPYAVFYCHYQKSKSRVFKVSLVGENGDRVEAISVCHLDTSHWSPNHPSFRVLRIEPGKTPVCHFFPADNFVWIPSPAT